MNRFLLVLLFSLSSLLAWPAEAQNPALLRISPAVGSLAVNQVLDLVVEIENVEDLYGFDVWVTYDPAVVEVVDANPSQDGIQASLGLLMDPGFVVLNIADNTVGRLQFAMTQLNPSEPKSGEGVLVVFKLRGKQAGSSALEIIRSDLSRRDGTAIPATTAGGQVTVSTAAGVQPATTSIPTQDPGTPLVAFTQPPLQAPATSTPAPVSAGQTPQETATPTPVVPTDTPLALAATALVETATTTSVTVAAALPTEASASLPTPEATEALPQDTPSVTAEPTVALAAVAATATSDGQGLAAATTSRSETSQSTDLRSGDAGRPERTLLVVGVVAVLLAAAIAGLIVIVLRRQRQEGMSG